MTGIGENVVSPGRLHAIRGRVDRVLGLCARLQELGYFARAPMPKPVTTSASVDGYCDECCKKRGFQVEVNMEMFEAWLDELDGQISAITKGAEATARVELEQSLPKAPKKGKKR